MRSHLFCRFCGEECGFCSGIHQTAGSLESVGVPVSVLCCATSHNPGRHRRPESEAFGHFAWFEGPKPLEVSGKREEPVQKILS